MNLRFVKNYLWKTTEQLFRETEKADLWSDRNHWHKPDQFPRFEVGIDTLIQSKQDFLFGKNGRILLNPGRSKFNGIRTTIISAN